MTRVACLDWCTREIFKAFFLFLGLLVRDCSNFSAACLDVNLRHICLFDISYISIKFSETYLIYGEWLTILLAC